MSCRHSMALGVTPSFAPSLSESVSKWMYIAPPLELLSAAFLATLWALCSVQADSATLRQ